MKRFFFYVLLCVGLSIWQIPVAIGQKIVDEKVPIAYTQLPTVKVGEDVGTFRAFLGLSSSNFQGTVEEDVYTQGLEMIGFERVAENYDLEVSLWLGGMTVTEKEARTIDHSYKDKKTGQMVYKYGYDYKVTVSFPAWLKVRDYQGNQLLQKDISTKTRSYTDFTSEFETVKARNDYWAVNEPLFLQKMQDDRIRAFIKDAQKELVAFSYIPAYEDLAFARVETKKNGEHDYAAFDQAWEKAKQAAEARDRTDIQTGNEYFAEAIQIWKSEAAQLDTEDKKARITEKIASECFLNCALACLWMNKFDLVEEYLALADDLKGGGMRSNKIEKDYEFRKGQFALHPDWTGTRQIAPRSGVATIYHDLPNEKLLAYNQEVRRAEMMAANQQNQPSRGGDNNALGNLATIVSETNGIIQTLSGNNSGTANQSVNQQQTLTPVQPATQATLSYESLKSPLSPALTALDTDSRKALLTAHGWVLNRSEYIDPQGRTQQETATDQCLQQQVHHFQSDQTYRIEAPASACGEALNASYQWMTFDFENLILNLPEGPSTLRILDLNAYLLVIETTSHSNETPLHRYTYVKGGE